MTGSDMPLQDEVTTAVEQARRFGTDTTAVEIKKASGGVPKTLAETVSAFANGNGGLIILGLDERAGFAPVSVNVKSLADALAGVTADKVEPAIRTHIEIVEVEGAAVVAAAVPPLDQKMRPCYVKTQGMEHGSYIRTHDGDRHLTSYEIHLLVSGRGQPQDDGVPVAGATLDDLDNSALEHLVARFRNRRGSAFEHIKTADVLRMAGVCPRGSTGNQVTLAGLLVLGRYPQEFFPQLNVTFVSYPTTDGRMMADGTRFLTNEAIDGSIPEMITGLVDAVTRNMTRRSVMVDIGREDRWEYPLEVIRELTVNALMHRDYHPLAQGTQVRIEMYPDRLVFSNPGGLYGAATPNELLQGALSSSRNAVLARLLEDAELPHTTRSVCENRGSGLMMVATELAAAGLAAPIFRPTVGHFTVELRNVLTEQPIRIVTPNEIAQADSAKRILDALSNGSKTTAELTETVGLSGSGVRARLRILENQKLVAPTENRFSRTVRWKLTNQDSSRGGLFK
ncbi:MAG: putative DNA binding domain-containing protein [Propionibacteriaceae bacterium]|jgi:ATP-dependent DNA helicase RecG|nr:putative DNA binding domain-containing protein [Propionibacteriaceae bacterium]